MPWKKETRYQILILAATTMLMKAWNSIPDGAFTNCFKSQGFQKNQ